MLVENGQRTLRPPFEKFQHCRLAEWLGKVANEAIGTEIAADLLIVENSVLEPCALRPRKRICPAGRGGL